MAEADPLDLLRPTLEFGWRGVRVLGEPCMCHHMCAGAVRRAQVRVGSDLDGIRLPKREQRGAHFVCVRVCVRVLTNETSRNISKVGPMNGFLIETSGKVYCAAVINMLSWFKNDLTLHAK